MNIEESIEYLKLKIKNDNLTIQGMFGDIYEEIQKDNTAIETLLTAYEKEKEKEKNKLQPDCAEPIERTEEMVNMRWVNHRFISKDKLKEILGIEETDDEKILSLLQTLVDENARLEDIEDRKVQIEYNNVFNKGVKSVEDKIKAKIEEIKEEKEHYLEINDEYNGQICDCIIEEYESFLEKE